MTTLRSTQNEDQRRLRAGRTQPQDQGGSMTREPILFITGASRSGTTLLSFVLRHHSSVFGLKELHYFGRAWDPRDSRRHVSKKRAVEAAADMLARQ